MSFETLPKFDQHVLTKTNIARIANAVQCHSQLPEFVILILGQFCTFVAMSLSPTGAPTPSYHPACQPHQVLECGQEGRFLGNIKRLHIVCLHFAFLLIRVLILGATGVGKTSLCSQFLSSANNNSYEPDSESVEKEVSVSINNQETRLVFIDHTHGEISASHSSIEMKEMSELRAVQIQVQILQSCANLVQIFFFKVFLLRLLQVDLHVLK